MRFPHLFSPFTIGPLTLKNRIFSTGHGTRLASRLINDELIAYHRARAKGGASLIVTEVAGVHETAYYTARTLKADTDECIPGYRRLAEMCHGYDCKVIGQLFHAGREITMLPDGSLPVVYSASATPNERFHAVPRAMSKAFIAEIVECYAKGAARFAEAGLDGVEVVAAHGYLLAQFLNPSINRRTDAYGGSAENRMRIIVEIARAVRARLGDRVMGLRISGSEPDQPGGFNAEETVAICQALEPYFDYMNVTLGSISTLGSTLHSVPPMAFEAGYMAPVAGTVKRKLTIPVLVSGRINRPDIAERILAAGQADMCAMTRGLIADPELPNKAREGRIDDIRACIACNQACIGHNHKGASISCIQYPESGRELTYGTLVPATTRRRIMVVGGGPGGMKAAAIAGARGHDVTLYEREARLGGQVRLAEKLPGRAEFGGLAEHLAREVELAGVRVEHGCTVDAALVRAEAPEIVILATGARPSPLDLSGGTEGAHVVDAWQVLRGQANVGGSVVIADWRCDWVGLGLAEMLARDGRRVRLCVNGYMPGETIQQYVRDGWIATLHKLGVETIPFARLIGADSDSVYFEHTASSQPMVCEGVETLVTALAREAEGELEEALEDWGGTVIPIGDCAAPRTAEEAVLEGLKVAWTL
jgi:2,4-dienoyl-CoA reductase-like NADH-dependent reductase (Old Yellow Enzyme family)